MLTKTIKVQVDVPEGVPVEVQETAHRRAEEAVILALWEAGVFTIREAAAELELGYHEFLDLLAARGIPVSSGELGLEKLEAVRRQLAGGRNE